MRARAGAGAVEVPQSTRARAVWIVITVCTLGFLSLCAILSSGLYNYLGNVTVPQPATLQLRQGQQLTVQRKGTNTQEYVTTTTLLHEGDVVTTGADTEGFVDLFNKEVTIQTYFSTTLSLDRLRTTRYFQNLRELQLTLQHGTLVIATADPGDNSQLDYTVATNGGDVVIPGGSRVRVQTDGHGNTTAVVDQGTATLFSNGRHVLIGAQQLAVSLPPGSSSDLSVQPAQEELVANGNFDQPPTSRAERDGLGTAAWTIVRQQVGGGGGNGNIVGTNRIQVVTETLGTTDISAVLLDRSAPGDSYARLGIHQDIDQPADYLHTIDLYATVKVVSQQATVGGPSNDVYPLSIRVNYTDTNGKAQVWSRNFRYVEGFPSKGDPGALQQGGWKREQFALKSSAQGQDMAVINSIEIFGYGSQFQSWVTGVSILARSGQR